MPADLGVPVYSFETTADGSPTLRLSEPGATAVGEAMHSSFGALAETRLVYGSAIQLALAQMPAARILSVGLGLGYVELLSAALALATGAGLLNGANLKGESFEADQLLRDRFSAWLRGDRGSVPADFLAAYDAILRAIATPEREREVQAALAEAVRSKRWQIRDALGAETKIEQRFNVICFDAFSGKTTPELWGERFLEHFLTTAAADDCVLSTYACTGALKRSLGRTGFRVEILQGFGVKRERVFATRGRYAIT